jgi:hypothetical protein
MSDEKKHLTRELQAAHDAVLNFDFAEHGETDFERMGELRRRLAVKREVRSRVNAYKRAQRAVEKEICKVPCQL